MQVTSTKRFVRSRAGGMVAAFGVLLIGVVVVMAVVLTSTGSQVETAVAVPASDSSVPRNNQITIKPDLWKTQYDVPTLSHEEVKFHEENLWQTPYAAPVLSYEEVKFQEENLWQTPYAASMLSYEEIRLWEDNTGGYHTESADTR